MSIHEQIQIEVSGLPPAQQQQVLEFVQALKHELDDEDKTMGEAALKLAAKVLEPEDFSDWDKPNGG